VLRTEKLESQAPYIKLTANRTLAAGESGSVVELAGYGATLPTGAPTGTIFTFWAESNAGGSISTATTIIGYVSGSDEAATDIQVDASFAYITLVYDGANWRAIGVTPSGWAGV
jgi:hypothetical protein